MHMGDIIDGHWDPEIPLDKRLELSMRDLEVTAGLFDRLHADRVFVVGNHCLQVPRERLMERLGMESCRQSRALCPGWRMVVLDSTALSHPLMEPFRTHDTEATGGEWREWWDANEGAPNRAPYNSGIGREQLAWLRAELARAEQARERVLVAIHHPVAPGQSRGGHRAWDGDEVAAALLGSPAFALLLCGHDHLGGYRLEGGRHFVTLEGALEAPEGGECCGVLELYPDRAVLTGRGTMQSREMALDPWL